MLTVDVFPPVVDDPEDYGRIVAANSLSDCWAMGGRALSVLNIMGFPISELGLDVMAEILNGGADAVAEAGALVVGGHTYSESRIVYGMAVTGLIHPDKILSNSGARPGDALVLTKPIGIGPVTTAIKPKASPADAIEAAVANMKLFNKRGAEVMVELGAHACTDVTGFGLLGHLHNITRGSGIGVVIHTSEIKFLPHALELAEAGYSSQMCFKNYRNLKDIMSVDAAIPPEIVDTMLDSETSGGLLVALPKENAHKMVATLNTEGHNAAVIGEFVEKDEKELYLVS